jgi:hypothetical protein
LKLEEVSTPKPSAGEVLVRIHAARVNPYHPVGSGGSPPASPGVWSLHMPWRRVGQKQRLCVFHFEPGKQKEAR